MNLFAELQRRNVLRAAVLYAGAVWLLAQIITQLGPVFSAPVWIARVFLIAAAIGFPFWLVFAWVYEWTPQGLKRESEVVAGASITRSTGRKLDRAIIGVLAVAVALLASGYFVRRNAPPVAGEASGLAPARSIAVLPFENLSSDKDNAYFADGIQDEILTSLAKIGALKVISRTSTERYASRPDDITTIARQLGVAHILEGSVQRVGERVRVNVQLIAAGSDSHLWAETYDRTLNDVFAVQSEVAQKIASSLRAQLTPEEHANLTKPPTANPAAYEAYLRGVALAGQGYDLGIARQSAMAFSDAVRLDPGFALAWARLTEVASYLYFNGVDPQTWTADSIKHAADTALRLQPDLIEARLAQGYYRYRALRDFGGASRAFATVLQDVPDDPTALQYLGLAERREGKWDEALAHLEQAANRDPRNPGLMTTIGGETLLNMRRYDEDRAWLDRALDIAPNSSLAIFYKTFSFLVQGRLEGASRVLAPIPQVDEDPQIAWARSYLRVLQRRYTDAVAELEPLLAKPADALNGWGPQLAISLGYAQRWAGHDAQARVTFDRLVTEIGPAGADRVDDSVLPIMLALAYAGLGDDQRAMAQAQHAVELYRSDAIYGPFADWVQAQVLAMSGHHEAAITILERSLKVPAGVTLATLRLDPAWDPLRQDPRFRKLIADDTAPSVESTP